MNHLEQPATSDWGWALSRDPAELVDLVRRRRAMLWVERLVRALDDRLDGALDLPATTRPAGARSRWLPADVIPLVGALSGQRGAMGAMRFSVSSHSLSSPVAFFEEASTADSDPLGAAHQGVALMSNALAELLPNAPRPIPELLVGRSSAGDSIAFAAGIGALLRLFGVAWPADLVATGGVDAARGRFTSVPADTLPGKIWALRAWGFTRIALVAEDSEELPDEIDGVVIERLPGAPAALPAALAALGGVDLDEADVARALALFDLRVGRAGAHMLDRVLASTEPFIETGSPLVRHLAYDMRSRALLHAGRSGEAHSALEKADALRGEGYLPDGRLRDILRYQQAAHRSIVHLDLAEWADDHPAHRKVDELIDELDDRWLTKHERLMRIFLANTRARRNEYMGRLECDEGRFDVAWNDLVADRDRWDELLERFARIELRLPDTSRARIENQLIDVAASRVASGFDLPDQWRAQLGEYADHSSPLVAEGEGAVLAFQLASGDRVHLGGSGFDALARLKKHVALGNKGLPGEIEAVLGAEWCGPVPGNAGSHRPPSYPWFVWLEQAALLAHREGATFALPCHDEHDSYSSVWHLAEAPSTSIGRILAQRSRAVLGALGVEGPEVGPPEKGTPLRRLYEELASRPESIGARAPY